MFKPCFYISVLFVISIWTCFAFALLITCSHVFLVPEPCFELFQGFSYKSRKPRMFRMLNLFFVGNVCFLIFLAREAKINIAFFQFSEDSDYSKHFIVFLMKFLNYSAKLGQKWNLNIAFKNLFIRCFSIFSCYLHEGGKPWILGSLDTWILDFECCLPKTGTNQISVCPNKNWGNFGAKFSFLYFGFPRKVGSISNRT